MVRNIKTVAITLVTIIIGFFGVQGIIAEEKGEQGLVKIKESTSKPQTYRFKFDETPGQEANPANWNYNPTATCGYQLNNACVIEVSADVVTVIGTLPIIDPIKLLAEYSSDQLPMLSDANGTRPDHNESVYLDIDNKN